MLSFIYPCDPFDNKKVDDAFEKEANVLTKHFKIHKINIDDLDNSPIFPNLEEDSKLIYRGWMLDSQQYKKLYDKTKGKLIVSPDEYLSSHHLPGWYKELENLTPASIICKEENAVETFLNSGKDKVFIKDFVKSLKTGRGSIACNEQEVRQTIEQMRHYRGHIEGGIVFRDVHDFVSTTEQRFFVLNNELFHYGNSSEKKIKIANEVKERLGKDRFFFSVDVIEDKSGNAWVVEIGDGQVSDLVGWHILAFSEMFEMVDKVFNFKQEIKNIKSKL